MNSFEKILYFLQGKMVTPKPFGLFHIMWIVGVVVSIVILNRCKKNYTDKQLKIVMALYGIIALILEILKQLIWSFNYDITTNIVTWNYEWYAFPFQLCTTPIYVSLICLFLKKGSFRNSLLSYISYITILGSIATIIMPDSCFTSDILVNVHTMWLHLGSFVLSVYLFITGEVKVNLYSLKTALMVFLIFVVIANLMNIIIYNTGILNGESFNMFYISPYFISSLPVFDSIQQNVPYFVFLMIYIVALSMGGVVIYFIANSIIKLKEHNIIKI